MAEITYRKLKKSDLNIFIELRLTQLQEEGSKKVCDLRSDLLRYYNKHIDDNTFVSWIAADGDRIIATSGLSIVEKPPYYQNPSGKIGILSSMFTDKNYRRQGIAKNLLFKIAEEAKRCDCGAIQITASDMGVLLYADFGFHKNGNFMQYNIK